MVGEGDHEHGGQGMAQAPAPPRRTAQHRVSLLEYPGQADRRGHEGVGQVDLLGEELREREERE